jgi:hypothetical protein
MKAKEYEVLCMAVENGVNYGYNRAHKHVEFPNEEEVKGAMYNAILGEILTWFKFDDETKND